MKQWKLTTALSLLMILAMFGMERHIDASTALHYGSNNGDVWDLQYRLRTLDLYTRPLDGKYGTATESSVENFQRRYGLPVDGLAGSQTWTALKKYTLDRPEMDVMAHIIYSEARGESYKGQVAVGAVVMNRIQSSTFPNTVRGVVFQKGAFSAVSDGQYWLAPNAEAYRAALDAVRGWDPTGNALYYFNPQTATSSWIWSRPFTVKIGHHQFTR